MALTFGLRLREELEARRMSIGMLSELAGISRSTVYDYANDKRVPDTPQCRLIARALKVPETHVLAWAGHLSEEAAELPPPAVEIIPELEIKLRLFTPEEQRRLIVPAVEHVQVLREEMEKYLEGKAAAQHAPPADAPARPDQSPSQ